MGSDRFLIVCSRCFPICLTIHTEIDVVSLEGISLGLTRLLPCLDIVFVKIRVVLADLLWRRLVHSAEAHWLPFRADAGRPKGLKLRMRPDCEAEDVFIGIDESEGRILFVVHSFKLEYFSFKIDDPTHFSFLS
jgi:hypothetical protein